MKTLSSRDKEKEKSLSPPLLHPSEVLRCGPLSHLCRTLPTSAFCATLFGLWNRSLRPRVNPVLAIGRRLFPGFESVRKRFCSDRKVFSV
ncbi:hypothetical protein CDAR_274241 [Caerostris darwini]|uniref:Uncharacterized protein n=1 Tax=Caerostris darwini TaxID=1538125 RepID=A0AAV4RG95_9ARAC|nr:hypothetical protein CDAR_274241 [Caerostris darwini]